MIYDMRLDSLLAGVSFECPAESAGKPRVVRCRLEGKNFSSAEIDRIFSASRARGESLYYVDRELLESIAPELIFTQDLCGVCQIDRACTLAAIADMPGAPALITLSPHTLSDVFENAVTIARSLGKEEAAHGYLAALQNRTQCISERLRQEKEEPMRVMLMEWMDPVYGCGHWIPEQIALAGGIDRLACPGGESSPIAWGKILRYDPEVLVIAPCGFDPSRSAAEISRLQNRKGWENIRAVKDGAVWIADASLFTQPSASTLVEGIELLAALFHPGLFSIPDNLAGKCISLPQTATVHGSE
jgi:iron complex transport system substrate-binding protein